MLSIIGTPASRRAWARSCAFLFAFGLLAGRAAHAQDAGLTLDEALQMNPGFRSPQGHLLYARALEAEGNAQKALEEYQALSTSYPGAEAAVRYAQLLKAQGRVEESRTVAKELLEQARIAPPHYRKAQRDWLDSAQRLALGR